MKKISRFGCRQFGQLEFDDDGDYVLASEYFDLHASHARLLKSLEAMNKQFGYDVVHPAGMVHDEHAAILKAIAAIAAEKKFTEET